MHFKKPGHKAHRIPTLQEYRLSLESLARSLAEGDPPWRIPEMLATGLPLRGNRQHPGLRSPFKGINALLLWQASRQLPDPHRGRTWSRGSGDKKHGALVSLYKQSDHGDRVHRIFEVYPGEVTRTPAPAKVAGVRAALLKRGVDAEAEADRAELTALLGAWIESELQPRRGEHRSPIHVRLRRALGSAPAESLLTELGLAFVLARLHWSEKVFSEVTPTGVPALLLPIAARVAWCTAERITADLYRYRHLLWPEPRPFVETPTIKDLRALASAWLPKVVEYLSSVGDGAFPYRVADVIRWIEARPAQAAAWLAAMASETPSCLDNVVAATAALLDSQTGMSCFTPSAGPGAFRLEELVADLKEALRNGTRPGCMDRLHHPEKFEEVWKKTSIRHTRSAWPNMASRLTSETIRELHLPFRPGFEAAICRGFTGLAAFAQGFPFKEPIDERQFYQDLQGETEELSNRRANRAIRKGMRPKRKGKVQQTLPFLSWPARKPDLRLNLERDGWSALQGKLLGDDAYRVVYIPRRDGTRRRLDVPSPELAHAQRQIGQALASYLQGTAWMTAFHPHRSPVWHARSHSGAREAVCVDISDFFGSIRREQVKPCFEERVFQIGECQVPVPPFAGWSSQGLEGLLSIVMRPATDERPEYLAQGSPASPVVANLAAVPMDRWIRNIAAKEFGDAPWNYSRYADDLVLSTTAAIPDFARKATSILYRGVRRMGWSPKTTKTRRWNANRGKPLILCGIVLPTHPDGPLRLPREVQRRLRAALHNLGSKKFSPSDSGLIAYAYAVTSDPSLLAHGRRLENFAEAVVGPILSASFLDLWGQRP